MAGNYNLDIPGYAHELVQNKSDTVHSKLTYRMSTTFLPLDQTFLSEQLQNLNMYLL